MSGFGGFPERALIFFEGLEADNSKPYWTDNKDVYEQNVRGPMLALLAELEAEFGAGKMFRPYRDVRFAKDKTPYKTNAAASSRLPCPRRPQRGSTSSAATAASPGRASSSSDGPTAANPTSVSPSVATSTRCDGDGGSATAVPQACSACPWSSASSTDRGRKRLYAVRHVSIWIRAISGTSPGRAARTATSATGERYPSYR